MRIKWNCPVCGCNAYQKYGGVTVPAKKIVTDEDGSEHHEATSIHMGTHYMCKGCSVFFANPRLFNRGEINSRDDLSLSAK